MPKAHPLELRERVVQTYLAGGSTYAAVGERYRVGAQSVVRWVGQFRRTGSLAPAAMGGARRAHLVDESGGAIIRDILDCVPDTTLPELCQAYLDSRGVTISPQTMSDTVRRLGYTRKRGSSGGWRRADHRS